jgi:YHS domain-containing protein
MTMKESKSVTKDPICGMTVDEATALHAERGGQTLYFCSDHCQQKFLAEAQTAPAMAKPVEKPPGKAIYTCPMHPEVQQDHPGNCPKCGMALELKTISAVEEWNRARKRGEWRSGIGSHICSRFGSAEIMSPARKLGVLK